MKAEKWKTGDFIQGESGLRREILAVVGKVVITSLSDAFTSAGPAYLQSELERRGWTLVTPPTLADKFPDGEMVLVRCTDINDAWDARFSCGRTRNGHLVCRVTKVAAIDHMSSSWKHVRKFDENLLGTVTS